MEGFIHPVDIQGHVEEAQIDFILRDFDTLKLIEYGNLLKEITFNVLKNIQIAQPILFKQNNIAI